MRMHSCKLGLRAMFHSTQIRSHRIKFYILGSTPDLVDMHEFLEESHKIEETSHNTRGVLLP